MSMLRWQINPALTAWENLWDAVGVAVGFLCAQYMKKVRMTTDEWREFMQIVKYGSVKSFLKNKVGENSSYSKEHSFYQNVYSVVFSRFYRDLFYFQKQFVKPKMSSYDRLKEMSLDSESDTMIYDSMKMPTYTRQGEFSQARQDLESWKRQSTHANAVKFRKQELEEEIAEARYELLGGDYKPFDWTTYRKERRSLREERLKNEDNNSSTGEGNSEGRRSGESNLHAERAGSREPVSEAKRGTARRKRSKR